MAVILFMGAVSGAHLNLLVSVAFAARGDFPRRTVSGASINPARSLGPDLVIADFSHFWAWTDP